MPPKRDEKMSKAPRGRKPPVLTLSHAAGRYGYQRHWLQKLLIEGRLEGYKNEFGHWRVMVRAMEALAKARRERELGWPSTLDRERERPTRLGRRQSPQHELESKTA